MVKVLYWNVICAFGYVQEVQKAGANINIVNASFGKAIDKHLFTEKNLLNTMIQELGTTGVLVVTSAGNDSLDTDFSDKRHFPSGFIADNILSIGGHDDANGATPTIDKSSNYGNISIDVAGPFRDWTVSNFNQNIAPVNGTSFSTAYVTGVIAQSFLENGRPTPVQLKTDFLNNNYGNVQYSSSLNAFIDKGAYVKR
ncbi:S8 family serine peptidase [Zobellia nedashkovskayae]